MDPVEAHRYIVRQVRGVTARLRVDLAIERVHEARRKADLDTLLVVMRDEFTAAAFAINEAVRI